MNLYLDASAVILHVQGEPRVRANVNEHMRRATDAGGKLSSGERR